MERKKVIISFAVAAFLAGTIFLPGFFELRKLRGENRMLDKRIDVLEEHNKALMEEIRKMKEDPSLVETKARRKFGIIRDKEYVYEKK